MYLLILVFVVSRPYNQPMQADIQTLQEQIAHLQSEIGQMSDELYSQQQEIALMRQEILQLKSRLHAVSQDSQIRRPEEDVPPPHY